MKQCRRRENFMIRLLLCMFLGILVFLRVGEAIEVEAAAEKPIKSMDGNWEYLANEDGTITTTDYLGKQVQVSVPLQIDGKTVRAIGERTFEGCKDMTGIVIPNGIKEIGNFAFNDCISLADVSLPDTITEIADFLFDDCISLTDIIIPGNVTKIGVCAFYGCSSLQSVVLPDGVTSIGNRAFSRCKELQDVTIPASVVSIGELAFEGNLGSVVIYTTSGSYAEKYAKDKNITVQIIEEPIKPTPTPTPTPTPDINNPIGQQPVNQPQVIQAKSYTKTYGSKDFSLNAATSGNGKLTYSVANKKVVTVNSSGKVTIKGYGKTTVTIKAAKTAQYQSATKKVSITVIPKTPSLISVTSPVKRQLSCAWSKGKSVTGYQVHISLDKKFKNNTIAREASGQKNSVKTPPLLKSKKVYYVRVRAYKKVGKIKYYSKWSKVKKVTVK